MIHFCFVTANTLPLGTLDDTYASIWTLAEVKIILLTGSFYLPFKIYSRIYKSDCSFSSFIPILPH